MGGFGAGVHASSRQRGAAHQSLCHGTAFRPYGLITINHPSAFASPSLFFFPPSTYTLLLRWDSQAAMKLLLALEKRR